MTTLEKENDVVWSPHPGAQERFSRRTEDIVLYGGTKGPGKSDALLAEGLRQINHPRYKGILIRRNFTRLTDLIDRAQEMFPKLGGKWNGDQKRFHFPSGATYGFGHCEHEIDKFNYQGKEYTYIGIDQCEEFSESMVNFIVAQNRTSAEGLKCYVRLTANPGGEGQAWVKRRFIDGKKPFQTYSQEYSFPDGRKITRTSCFVPGTIYDNPTLLKNNPTYLANLMELPEAERKAYLEGDWSALMSQCVFDRAGMDAQEKMIREPIWQGLLEDRGESVEFVVDPQGRLTIYTQPDDGRKYLIAADVAKGVDGGDYSVALVFDRRTREVVAKWHGRCDPLEFGRILYGLGLYFNGAKLAVETWPGPGVATGSKLTEMGYPNLYRRWMKDGKEHREGDDVGFVTDQTTRAEAIALLMDVIRRKNIAIRDRGILDEFYNFIRHDNGRISARAGCHDDMVMACAIGIYCMTYDPVAEIRGDDRAPAAILVSNLTSLPGKKNYGRAWRASHGG